MKKYRVSFSFDYDKHGFEQTETTMAKTKEEAVWIMQKKHGDITLNSVVEYNKKLDLLEGGRELNTKAIRTVKDLVRVLQLAEFQLIIPCSRITSDLEHLFLKKK